MTKANSAPIGASIPFRVQPSLPVTQPQAIQQDAGLRVLRLPEVLRRYPVSRSAWMAGVAEGKYPRAVKLGARSVGWKSCDIDQLIQSLPQA